MALPQRSAPSLFKLIDTARSVQEQTAAEAKAVVFYPSFLCHVSFPASSIPEKTYELESGPHRLSVSSPNGIPYGIFPRLAISWLTTYVIRRRFESDSDRVFLGDKFADYIQSVIGRRILSGGKQGDITKAREAYISLVSSHIVYSYNLNRMLPGESRITHYNIASDVTLWQEAPYVLGRPKTEFQSTLILGPQFHADIIDRGCPLDYRILKSLSPKCLATDIYTWANYRAKDDLRDKSSESFRTKRVAIPWPGLRLQFGVGYDPKGEIRYFKKRFLEACRDVHMVYPGFCFADKGDTVLFTLRGSSVQRTVPAMPSPDKAQIALF